MDEAAKSRVDALAPLLLRPERELGTFTEIVQAAARRAEAPIAALTFALVRCEMIHVSMGLPRELSASGGWYRRLSLSRDVVDLGLPARVDDARRDLGLPRSLVDAYGIRSFVGVPVWHQGVVVGCLFVASQEAGSLAPSVLRALEDSSALVSDVLAELSGTPSNGASTVVDADALMRALRVSVLDLVASLAGLVSTLERMRRWMETASPGVPCELSIEEAVLDHADAMAGWVSAERRLEAFAFHAPTGQVDLPRAHLRTVLAALAEVRPFLSLAHAMREGYVAPRLGARALAVLPPAPWSELALRDAAESLASWTDGLIVRPRMHAQAP